MDWVKELANKRNKLASDLAKLDQGIQGVWNDLCTALTHSVDYYKGIYPREQFQTNGEPYSTWTLRKGDELILTVRLVHAERRLIVEGSDPLLSIEFALDAKDNVWLSQEGKKIGVQSAAERILRPLLFPEAVNSPFVRLPY